MGLLDGKRALIMGVANKRSIAWGIATAFQREGAELAFTYAIERLKDNVVELVATLPDHERIPLLACDVTKQEEIDALFAALSDRWGKLDLLVHCIAFAPLDDLRGKFVDTSRVGFATTLEVSAYSLVALCRGARPLFENAGGASVISLTYNAVERVMATYGVMAMAKAVLEAETRYLAVELGPANVRVNCISAGPIKTMASSVVKGISYAREIMERLSPLHRNITQEEVGNVAVFLASDLSRCITGATIFADNGASIVGPVEPREPSPQE